MKRVLAIIILGFALSYPLSSTSHAADPYIGQGEVKLSYNTIRNFKEYIRNNEKRPSAFLITIDGTGSYYIYCPYGQCQSIKKKYRIDQCERYYNGKECKIFAMRRTIKWKNGINTGKAKQSKFKYNLSDIEFDAKLKELGFTGTTISSTTTEPKITKKKKKPSSDLVKNLSDLKKLLDDGVITQEEFEIAKKKLLN